MRTTRRTLCAVVLTGSGLAACGEGTDIATSATVSSPDNAPAARAQDSHGRPFRDRAEVVQAYGDHELYAGASEVARSHSLPEMSRRSDLIAEGRVVEIEVGGTIGPQSDSFEYVRISLDVQRYLKGSGPSRLPVDVYVGAGMMLEHRDELVGSSLIAFVTSLEREARALHMSTDEIRAYEGRYRFVSSQGVVVPTQDGVVQPWEEPSDPMKVRGRSRDAFVRDVRSHSSAGP